jgi:hypothetical protein
MSAWRADPIVWGHWPRVFEVFLEPTCPFSIRAFGKLENLLDKAGEDRITVKVRLQSQPWAHVLGRPVHDAAVREHNIPNTRPTAWPEQA